LGRMTPDLITLRLDPSEPVSDTKQNNTVKGKTTFKQPCSI